MNKTLMTREQWMLATALTAACCACNAPFCSGENGEPEEVNRDPGYIHNVAEEVANRTSPMMLSSTIYVLARALTIAEQARRSAPAP